MKQGTLDKMNDILFLQSKSNNEKVDEFVDVALGYSFHISESHSGAKHNTFSENAQDRDIAKNGYLRENETIPERLLDCMIADSHRILMSQSI